MKTEHARSKFTGWHNAMWLWLPSYNRDRRWRTTAMVDLTRPTETRKVMFDLSVNDSYHDPGYRCTESGATEPQFCAKTVMDIHPSSWCHRKGDLPRLDRWNINTLKHETIFQSREQTYESVLGFVGDAEAAFVTRYESPKDPPNFYLVDPGTKTRKVLTDFKDPAPQFTA